MQLGPAVCRGISVQRHQPAPRALQSRCRAGSRTLAQHPARWFVISIVPPCASARPRARPSPTPPSFPGVRAELPRKATSNTRGRSSGGLPGTATHRFRCRDWSGPHRWCHGGRPCDFGTSPGASISADRVSRLHPGGCDQAPVFSGARTCGANRADRARWRSGSARRSRAAASARQADRAARERPQPRVESFRDVTEPPAPAFLEEVVRKAQLDAADGVESLMDVVGKIDVERT